MLAQAIHIFLKDTRRLAYVIGIALFFTATGVVRDGSSLTMEQAFSVVALLPVAIAWWFLTVTLILGEPMAGDRQFWLTRPYRRASLVLSKCLFLIAFIQFPVLITDIAVLMLRGFAPSEYVTALLAHQIGISCILAPAVAIACVSRNLTTAVLTMLGLVLLAMSIPMVAFGALGRTDNSHWYWWIRSMLVDFIVILGIVAVTYLQLWRRNTLASLCVIAVAAITGSAITNLPSRELSARLSSAFRKPSANEDRIQIAYSTASRHKGFWRNVGQGAEGVRLRVPLVVTGVPPDRRLRTDFTSVQLTVDGSKVDVRPTWFEFLGEHGVLAFDISSGALQAFGESSGRLQATLYVTVIEEHEVFQTTFGKIRSGAWARQAPCFDGSKRSSTILPDGRALLQCISPLQQYGFYIRRDESWPPHGLTVTRRTHLGILPSWKGVSLMSPSFAMWGRDDLPLSETSIALVDELSVAEIKRTIDIDVPRISDLAR